MRKPWSTDRYRADRLREGKRRQRVDDSWRTSSSIRPKGIVHGGEAIFRVAGSREERACYREKMGVVDPLLNSFRAANRDDYIPSSIRLADEPDRDLLIATARIDVCREVVCINRRHDRVSCVARDQRFAGGISEVVRRYSVCRVHKLCEFNGFIPVHNSLSLYEALPSEVVWWAAARQPTRCIEFFADTIRNANTPTPGRHTPGPS